MARTADLIQRLNDAHATERTLISTLTAHRAMTPAGPYRDLLERHLGETRRHARDVRDRLDELGASDSLISLTINLAETLVGQTLSLAKGPLDLLRGPNLLKNARDECASEALEIATYDAIEAVATALGDGETARLAASIRAEEERMLADLRALIPQLAGGTGAPPIPGYDQLNTGQAAARLADLDAAGIAAVLAYERAHQNRRGVIERAEQLI